LVPTEKHPFDPMANDLDLGKEHGLLLQSTILLGNDTAYTARLHGV